MCLGIDYLVAPVVRCVIAEKKSTGEEVMGWRLCEPFKIEPFSMNFHRFQHEWNQAPPCPDAAFTGKIVSLR